MVEREQMRINIVMKALYFYSMESLFNFELSRHIHAICFHYYKLQIYLLVMIMMYWMHWTSLNQIPLAIDRASSIMGHRTRRVVRMCA